MEKPPDIEQAVDAMYERLDAAYFEMMRKIIERMHKQDDDIMQA